MGDFYLKGFFVLFLLSICNSKSLLILDYLGLFVWQVYLYVSLSSTGLFVQVQPWSGQQMLSFQNARPKGMSQNCRLFSGWFCGTSL